MVANTTPKSEWHMLPCEDLLKHSIEIVFTHSGNHSFKYTTIRIVCALSCVHMWNQKSMSADLPYHVTSYFFKTLNHLLYYNNLKDYINHLPRGNV